MRRGIALALIACAGVAELAQGQAPDRHDPWKQEVVEALTRARAEISDAATGGEVLRHGMLAEGEGASVSVTLQAGQTYVVVATCDRDCARLSLRVVDGRRYELDSDRSATRQPVLRITPVVTGGHQVEVTMAGCTIGPCRYGVLVVPVRPAAAVAR